jgi:anti-sigma factor RsiW
MPWHRILRRRSPRVLACRELVEIVADYLDNALPPRDRADFEAHLEECEPCNAYLDQLRQTTRLIGRAPGEPLPDELEDRLLDVFRDWKSA